MPTKEERSTSQSDGSGFRHSTSLATISASAALEREDLSVVAASASSASSAHQKISETTSASDFGSASLNVVARMDGVELLDRSSQLPRPSAPSRPALVPAETVPLNIPSAYPPTSISPIRNTLSTTEKMDDLADAFLSGPSRRADQGLEPVLQPEPLPTDISELEKLRLLVTRRAWEAVVVVGMQLLRDSKSIQHAPIYSALLNNPAQALPSLESQQAEVVEIMSLCCHGWWKSRQREALCQELDRWSFGHHVGGHAPSWIPWSLHIWGAISLQFVSEDGSDGDPKQIAIDALWAIRTKIRLNAEKDASLGSQSASLLQVEHVLSNIFVQRQEWRMAVACLERMMEALDGLVANEVETLVEKGQRSVAALVLKHAYQSEILSRQGRILLQAGAVSEAAQIFQQASDVWNALDNTAKDGVISKHVATRHVPCQLLSNEGLVCFAYGKYDEALEFFRQATERMRANQCTVPEYSRDDWVGFVLVSNETYEGLYSQVLNNLALCALYTSRLQKAIQVMESLIREDPTRYLTERVAMNLCTLYELGADTAVAARQKRTLQIIAKRFLLQDIGPECFRSNTSG